MLVNITNHIDFNVDDFISREVLKKEMKLGWVLSVKDNVLSLDYRMLNFDWNSVVNSDDCKMNAFLESESYKNYKEKMARVRKSKHTLHYDSHSIADMKACLEQDKIDIDLDRMVRVRFEKMSQQNSKAK